MRLLIVWLWALLLAAPATAQVSGLTWDDPTLPEAVRSADLVVLARAEKVASNGAAYRVESTLAGPERDGDLLAVTGLHHPELRERPPVEPGDRAYLLLRGEPQGEGFVLPTPTFGRFLRTKEGGKEYVVASLGGVDTFARVPVAPSRFEAILRGLRSGKAPELVASAREILARPDAAPSSLYLSLSILAELGSPSDCKAALALATDARYAGAEHQRLRMAALRLLGRQGGVKGAKALYQLVHKDPEPAVQSVGLTELRRACGGRVPPALGSKLGELAPRLSAEPIRYGDAHDPRKNFLDGPAVACLVTLAHSKSAAGVAPALAFLEGEDLPAIEGALKYFELLGDRARARAIAERMRPDGSTDAFINRRFSTTLEDLTGAQRGERRADWLAWLDRQRVGEEPEGPPRPPGKQR